MHGEIIVKLTAEKLREIIKEEMENFLAEEKLEYGVYRTEKEAEEHIRDARDTTMTIEKIKKGNETLFKVVEKDL